MPFTRTAYLILAIAIGGAFFLGVLALANSPAQADDLASTAVPPDVAAEISQKVLERLSDSGAYEAHTLLFSTRVDDIALSQDGSWAIAWMVPVDRTTGQDLAVEPGLAILHQTAGEWQPRLPLDVEWRAWLAALPEELISAENKDFWLVMSAEAANPVPAAARSGYLLPWAKNKVVNLSRSIAHDKDFPNGSSHFSFDFADGTMFEILAAKSGEVWMTKDSEPNGCDGNSGCSGNYIILKETDATGDYFQLYLHLAQNSIPDELVKGVKVRQGDPIGLADDTGYSTGHHLHFMVHRTSNSYYGTAIDITFDDVPINGGRPRAKADQPYCLPSDACEVFQYSYVSGNEPCVFCTPPEGDYTTPDDGLVVTDTVQLSGWGVDNDASLRYGQFLAAYNGKWYEVGPQFKSQTLNYTWNLCDSNVPDGPIILGLRLRDNDFTTAELLGLRIITKAYICPTPPPACTPAANEVALYTGAGYTGSCSKFGVGAYPNGASLGSVGADNAESILLGAGVQATLFAGENMTGRGETFAASDSNLADNLIRSNWARSLMVQPKNAQPFVPEPAWPASGTEFNRKDPIILYWENSGAVVEYQARLVAPLTQEEPIDTAVITTTWQREPYWFLDNLPLARIPGLYSWQVRGRGPAITSTWSSLYTFTLAAPPQVSYFIPIVQKPAGVAASAALPQSASLVSGTIFSDDVESEVSKWQGSGLWHRQKAPTPTNARSGQYFWWAGETNGTSYYYDSAKVSTLTSDPISIPDTGTYFLRFYSYYDTENDKRDWDQRWVQVSANGGPFENVLQLYDDPLRYWMQSPPVSLEAYRGETIVVRFVFDTVDNAPPGDRSNKSRGWLLDDITINDSAPQTCSADPSEPNDDPANATVLTTPADSVIGAICPGRDADYYVFTGQAGDRLLVDIDARTLTPASSLDSVVELLDSDGRSLVTLNDDEIRLEKLDSYLKTTLPRTGTYYLRVTSWYSGLGGNNYNYTLDFAVDAEIPKMKYLSPPDDVHLKAGEVITLSARITETVSGLDRVEFLWHDPDWFTPTWKTIPGGGLVNGVWQAVFDPQVLSGSQSSIDLYIQAWDRAGNTIGAGARRLVADVVPPQVSLGSLEANQTSNTFQVTWTGTDDLSGIYFFEVERRVDGGDWVGFPSPFLPGARLEVVEPGHTYEYRLRARDNFLNISDYTSRTTTVPLASVLCATPDAFEPDNTFTDASPAGLNQAHNFCDPGLTGFAPDEDWVAVTVLAGQTYLVNAQPVNGSAAWPVVTLLADDGTAEIVTKKADKPGQPLSFFWKSDRNGTIYARVKSNDPQVLGSGAAYTLTIDARGVIYLPVAIR